MSTTSRDDEFERLAQEAGIPDIPVTCDPMRPDAVLTKTEARVLGRGDTTDQGPRTMVCGVVPVLVQVGGAWKELILLELAENPDMAAVLAGGPGPLLETLWWIEQVGPSNDVVLFCSVATSDRANDPEPRRFTIGIAPSADVIAELTSVEVFALALVDPDLEDVPGVQDQGLAWFIANDHGLWATILENLPRSQ